MKKIINRVTFIAVFLLSFILSTNAIEAHWTKICEVINPLQNTCIISGSAEDKIAKFTIIHRDSTAKVDPYTVKMKSNSIENNRIERGSPYLQDFKVYDYKNGKTYTYTSRRGKYLNDFSYNTISINKNLGYYPASGERPATTQFLKSGGPLQCGLPQGIFCKNYSTVTQFVIK